VSTTLPPANFGRILAAYGGVFVAGSLLWGAVLDGFRPDRYNIIGAAICLVGRSSTRSDPGSTFDQRKRCQQDRDKGSCATSCAANHVV
jgi:hypothetical protein